MQAAQNELAGAEAGDGRDSSNRSLQERLADAQNSQVRWGSGTAVQDTNRLQAPFVALRGTHISMLCAQLLFSWCSTGKVALLLLLLLNPFPLPAACCRRCYCCCCLQTEAEAEAKAAETRSKHTQKQLAEQRKALASKEKEGSKLVKELARERSAVEQCRQAAAALGHDPAAAAALEGDVEAQGGEVRRLRDRVDELASHLAGGMSHILPRLLACWLPCPWSLLALAHADACVFAISHSALLLKLVGRRRSKDA